MFYGEDEHTLDARGRVHIPARHREELGEVVFLVRGLDGQINVYPEPTWQEMVDRLAQAGQSRTALRDTRRYVHSASSAQLDKQGRLLLPNLLRKYAQVETDAVITGNDDHIEIWGSEYYEENWDRVLVHMRQTRDDTETMVELDLSI